MCAGELLRKCSQGEMEEVVQGSKDTKLRAVCQAKLPEDEFSMVSRGRRETPLQGT